MSYVLVAGEALVDMVSQQPGVPLEQVVSFERCPGGAPANVAVGLARLGVPVRFVGVVGDDPFGRFLRGFLADNGVDVSGMRLTAEALTTLAFVANREGGERQFAFYRKPGADTLLRSEDLDAGTVRRAAVLHHGTVTLADEPGRSALLAALEEARAAGVTVSLDVNYRAALWGDPARALDEMRAAIDRADLVKVSREELALLAGRTGREGALRLLAAHRRVALLVVTEGADGSWAVGRDGQSAAAPTFAVEAVDTTGAGDAFWAALLWRLWEAATRQGVPVVEAARRMSPAELARALRFANAAGALAVRVRGAMTALPTRSEVETLVEAGSR
ncbi:carbohydrate kinase family protein [Geochorda subterranea]|uniref:Carbohydrate kinase n=1 Tax=Geochorda subterranea TaxID=3109564 RepID=A0ABZ1BNW9_9FIRM|nr:carbohydrate kinase [Limnochorda sp. LNt]WRP14288.1 carbohydrate kinase [Limnochorda sp. LNt]